MNLSSIVTVGFAATIVLTTMLSTSQGLGYTRMSIPFLLGTIFTSGRDRAMVIGAAVHVFFGLIFALLYAAVFESIGRATVPLGALGGIIHAFFVLSVGMAVLPGLHPYMVSEYYGPTPNRVLQPPGFLALNYGRGTPVVTIAAHIVYGAIIGGLYHLKP
jgi:hypothetical protein